jgi:hypothetical protein
MLEQENWISCEKVAKALAQSNDQFNVIGDSERCVFLKSNNEVTFCPFVHHNVLKFIGMDRKSHYLIWLRHKTQFVALHKSGVLQTWCLITGFKLTEVKIDPEVKDWLKYFKAYKRDNFDETYQHDDYQMKE